MNKVYIALFSILATSLSYGAREITFGSPTVPLNSNTYSFNQSSNTQEDKDNPYLQSSKNRSSNQSNTYTTSFGNNYQYDLSKPLDRTKYSTDVNAQLRDQMDLNPTRTLERGVGQYGGGILDKD